MRATRTQGARLLLTIGMAVVLTACTRPSPPDQPTAPRGATAPATAATTPPVPAPALAPEARAGRGEVVVTLFHETHMHVFGGGTVQTGSRHVLEAFAAAGMDVDTFGYDVNMYVPGRTDHLRDLVARSRFVWVSANVREGSRPSEAFAARQGARLWVLKQVGGIQVGITGVVSPDFVHGDGAHAARVAPTVALLDPVKALREVVPKMRAAGAQVVVVLSHLFFEEMERVAEQVDGVDAILGSHQGPPTGYLAEPEVIRGTIISKPGHDLAAVGQLDLVVRRGDGRVARFGFQRHPLTPGGPSSPAVKAILDRYRTAR